MSRLREITKLNGRRKVRVNVRYTIPENRPHDCMDFTLVLYGEGFKVIITYDEENARHRFAFVAYNGDVSYYNKDLGVFGIGGYLFDDLELGSGEVGITLYLDNLMFNFANMYDSKLFSIDLLMRIYSDKGNYGKDEKAVINVEVNSGYENFSECRRFIALEDSDTIASFKVFDTEEDGARWFTTNYPTKFDPAISR